MSKKWNRDAFYRLLRFGRKNEGGWTDIDIEWQDGETIPDDNDIDLLMAAPLMYEALKRIAKVPDCGCVPCRGQCDSVENLKINAEEIREIARAALQAAKGGGDGE